jgi:SNF2 family DNA or RNA helicase
MFLGNLRPYQEQARAFLLNRGSALLALDLGTGKTVVSIAAIEELRERGDVKCALLIMSSSLTKQWEERINQFTDSQVSLLDSSLSPARREAVMTEAISQPPSYLVMGLRQVVKHADFIKRLNPDLILIDEVTCIKNFGTQQTKAIKKLKPRFRIGLTAEPIENGKAEEMFSIMQWIDPHLFGDWQSFERSYINRNSANIITGYKNIPELHSTFMKGCYVKRRTDPGVSEFMPTVKEFNCRVEQDPDMELVYRHIVRELLQALYDAGPRASKDLAAYYAGERGSDDHSGVGRLGPILSAASLLLSSPALLRASGDAYNESGGERGSKYAASLLEQLRGLSMGSKFEACIELAEEYLKENPLHKVVVFSRYKGILPLLQEELQEYNPVLFTGDLNGKQRGEAISSFCSDPDVRLFLSSDAGGYGVDLHSASHLINYNLPLSSGVFKQRNGRHVRASSTFREVTIDNLIFTDSIEEYQLARLNYKAKVSAAALTGLSDRAGNVEDDTTSLTKFLENYLKESNV